MPTLVAFTIPNLKRIALFTCSNVKEAVTFSLVSSIFRETMVDYKGLLDVWSPELRSMTPTSIREKYSNRYADAGKNINFFISISYNSSKYSCLAWVLGEVLQHPNAPTIFSLHHFELTGKITSLLSQMINGSNGAALTVIFDCLEDQLLRKQETATLPPPPPPLPVALLLKKQLQNPGETVCEGLENQIPPVYAHQIPPFALMDFVSHTNDFCTLKILVNGLLKLGLLKEQLEKVHSLPGPTQLQFYNTNKTVMQDARRLQPDVCFEFLFEISEREFGPDFVKNQLILRRSFDANPKRLLELICDYGEQWGLEPTIRWSHKYGILEQQIDEDQLGVKYATSRTGNPPFALLCLAAIEKCLDDVSQRDALVKKVITQAEPSANGGKSVMSLVLFNHTFRSLDFLFSRMKRLGILQSIILHGKNSLTSHNILHEAAQVGAMGKLQQILELIVLDKDSGLGFDAVKQLLTEQLPGSLDTPLHLVTDLACFRGMLAACKDEQTAQDVLDNYKNSKGKSVRQVKMEMTTAKGFVKLFKETKPNEMWKDAREITKKTTKKWKIV